MTKTTEKPKVDLGQLLHGEHLAPAKKAPAPNAPALEMLKKKTTTPADTSEQGYTLVTRLMDAYLKKQDTRFMELLLEVDDLEERVSVWEDD